MICRWCGEKVDPKERKCPACGHEMPPLSDCGGYIGVTQPSPQRESVHARSQTEQRAEDPQRRPGSSRRSRSDGRTVIVGVLVLALAVSILLSIMTGRKVDHLADTLTAKPVNTGALTGEISAVKTVQDQITSDLSAVKTTQEQIDSDLKKLTDTQTTLEQELTELTSLQTSLEAQKEPRREMQSVNFQLEESRSEDGAVKSSLSYQIETPTNTSTNTAKPPKYDWKYRRSDGETWQPVNSEALKEIFTADGNTLTVDWKNAESKGLTGSLRIQCVCTISDADGGSLELSLSTKLQAPTDETAASEPTDETDNTENGRH